MEELTCPACGVRFQPGSGNQRYCNRRCVRRVSQAKYRRRHPEKIREQKAKVYEKVCAWCGRSYRTTRWQGRFCGVQCAGHAKATDRTELDWRQCQRCGRWRVYRSGRGRFCSPECAVVDTRAPRPCVSCGEEFRPKRGSGSKARYCSRQCKQREASARRRGRQGPDLWRGDRVNALVRRWDIYERDRWICQLCRKRVPKAAVVPDPKAPTLDHVVPLSCGGEHVVENLQLAHYGCNSRKKAGVMPNGEQLRLVG